jgi:tetrahydromethanopterin S-methyltransferase subunit G
MGIDAKRLDEILAEFTRQSESLRARLAGVTAIHEIMEQMKAEFSRTMPDAARVRVFVMSRDKTTAPVSIPPDVALTEAEMQVVLARLPEIEARASEWQQIIGETTQRLLRGPAAQPTAAAPPRAVTFDAEGLDAYLAALRQRIAGLRARLAGARDGGEARALYQQAFGTRERPDPDLFRLQVLSARAEMKTAGARGFSPLALTPGVQSDPAEIEAIRARLPEIQALLRETTGVVFERQRAFREPAAPASPAGPPAPDHDDAADAATLRADDAEALAWLSANPGEAPLAANRFDASDARAFVESLYRAGAQRVVVASECIRDDEDPPYADGVRVVLPEDPARRGAVLDLVNREMAEEGFDAEPDRGQQVVFLWWD